MREVYLNLEGQKFFKGSRQQVVEGRSVVWFRSGVRYELLLVGDELTGDYYYLRNQESIFTISVCFPLNMIIDFIKKVDSQARAMAC